MPAFPSDIVRATRAARTVTWAGDVTNGRDGLKSIEPGFFEAKADASTVLALKGALIGTARRRFLIAAQGEIAVDPASEIPSFRVVDSETSADLPALLCRYEYDMESEVTTTEVLG